MGKNIMLSLVSLYAGISATFVTAAYFNSKLDIEERIMNIVNKISSKLFCFLL